MQLQENRISGNSKREGMAKEKKSFLEGLVGGRRCKPKRLLWGRYMYGVFLEQHNITDSSK